MQEFINVIAPFKSQLIIICVTAALILYGGVTIILKLISWVKSFFSDSSEMDLSIGNLFHLKRKGKEKADAKQENKNNTNNNIQVAPSSIDEDTLKRIILCSSALQKSGIELYSRIATLKNLLLEDQVIYAKTCLDSVKNDIIQEYYMKLGDKTKSANIFSIIFTYDFDNIYMSLRSVFLKNHLKEKDDEEFLDMIQLNGSSYYKELLNKALHYDNDEVDNQTAISIIKDYEKKFCVAIQNIFDRAKQLSIDCSRNIKTLEQESKKSEATLLQTYFPSFDISKIQSLLNTEEIKNVD